MSLALALIELIEVCLWPGRSTLLTKPQIGTEEPSEKEEMRTRRAESLKARADIF